MQWDFSLGASVPRIRCWARLPGWIQQISPWKLLFLAKGRSPAKGSTYSFRLGSKKGAKSWRACNLRRQLKGKQGWEGNLQESQQEGAKDCVIVSGCLLWKFSYRWLLSTWGCFQFAGVFLGTYQKDTGVDLSAQALPTSLGVISLV